MTNLSLITRTTLVSNSSATPQDALNNLEERYPQEFKDLKWLFYYEFSVGWDNETEVWVFIDVNNKLRFVERGYTDKGEWENSYQYSFEEESLERMRIARVSIEKADLFEYVFNNKVRLVEEQTEINEFNNVVNNFGSDLGWIVNNKYEFCYVDDFDGDVTIKVMNAINNDDRFRLVGTLYYENGWAPDLFYRVRTS